MNNVMEDLLSKINNLVSDGYIECHIKDLVVDGIGIIEEEDNEKLIVGDYTYKKESYPPYANHRPCCYVEDGKLIIHTPDTLKKYYEGNIVPNPCSSDQSSLA